MRHEHDVLEVATRGQGLWEFTNDVHTFVSATGMRSGLLTLFCRHTSCSLIVQENADPDVQVDLIGFFRRLVPEGMDWLSHTLEGPDDMPAHIKAALTQTSLSIPISDGAMMLGTWQGIYLFEHRYRPHARQVVAQVMGD